MHSQRIQRDGASDTVSTARYLSLAEFCRRAGLSASTVRRLVRDRAIAFLQPRGKGGKLLFPPDALERGAGEVRQAAEVSVTPRAGRRPKWTTD